MKWDVIDKICDHCGVQQIGIIYTHRGSEFIVIACMRCDKLPITLVIPSPF